MDSNDCRLLFRLIFDLIIIVGLVVPYVLVQYIVPPFQRGFFCDDHSLRYPYKDSTVSILAIAVVGSLVPAISIVLLELRNKKNAHYVTFCGFRIPPWMTESYRVIGFFVFGGLCEQLTSHATKVIVGRLRPNFWEVCQPNIDCSIVENMHRYITEYHCSGTDPYHLSEMHLSFPSGHASFAAYSMIFLILYIQRHIKWSGSKLLRPSIQLILILIAWFVGITRVTDFKHHWDDVLMGYIIGIVYVLLVFQYLVYPKTMTQKRRSSDTNREGAIYLPSIRVPTEDQRFV